MAKPFWILYPVFHVTFPFSSHTFENSWEKARVGPFFRSRHEGIEDKIFFLRTGESINQLIEVLQ
jgi:hypothetical protein